MPSLCQLFISARGEAVPGDTSTKHISKNNYDPTLRPFTGYPPPNHPSSPRQDGASYTLRRAWASPAGGALPLPSLTGSLRGLVWGPVGGGCKEGRAVSQPLRYSSSSCFSGDKGLPSPFLGPGRGEMFPPVWAGVPEGLNSRQMSQVLLRDPFRGAHRNLLRELSWPPFVSSPHLLETAAKAQQDGASRGWEPSGRGGRPRGRQGGGGGHSENPVLFAQGFLVCWLDHWWQWWACLISSRPTSCLWEHARRDSLQRAL